MRFTIDATTPAPPVPKKSEAWPGGEILTPNKEATLAAFHSRKCRTAAAAVAAAAAAARAVEPWPHTPDRCVFFFSHEVGEFACLSQFFHAEFTDETGQNYSCMEQYMMAEKAQAMGDEASRALLLAAGYNPAQYKALGRQISPWVQQVWDDVRESVVTRGNILKFSQDAALGNVGCRSLFKFTTGAPPTQPWQAIGPRACPGLRGPATPRTRPSLVPSRPS